MPVVAFGTKTRVEEGVLRSWRGEVLVHGKQVRRRTINVGQGKGT